jgi:hypothetical protein
MLEFQKDKLLQIQQIDIKVNVIVKTTPLKMDSGRYLGKKIAYGSTKNIFNDSLKDNKKSKVLISLTTKEGKLDAGVMMIPGLSKTEPMIKPMKIVEKKRGKDSYRKK